MYYCSWRQSTEYFPWETLLDIAVFCTFSAFSIWGSVLSLPNRGPLCLFPQSQRSQPSLFQVTAQRKKKINTLPPNMANDLQNNHLSLISLLSSELKQLMMSILREPTFPRRYLIDNSDFTRPKGNS